MLYVPTSDLMLIVDNIGATITDAGWGTSMTSGGSTHTKGTAVSLIAGSLVTEDVYGVAITFVGGNGSVAIRRYLVDLLIDHAGGSTWRTIINNLYVNNAGLLGGGYRYYFPLYLRKGTSIGMQAQCNLASTAVRASVQLFGKPSRPELFRFGTKVQTYGVDLTSTSGTAVTPGTSAVGAYAQIGTLTDDAWWWQWGGIGYNDSSFVINAVFGDIAVGDVNNKRVCMENCAQSYSNQEIAGKDAFGMKVPTRNAKAGELVYVRCACTGTPETTPTTTVYALS